MRAAKKRRNGATAKLPKQTLRLPAPQGLRLIALGFLEDAEAASKRLAQSHDTEVLHEFRVALRRLRSWLRAFKAEFDGAAKKKDRRTLRDIARTTGFGRDLDVQLLWLRKAGKGLSRKRRRGADWMTEYVTAQKEREGDPVDAALLKKFSRIRKDLGERLSTVEQPVDGAVVGPTLASVIASQLTNHVEELDDALAKVGSVADDKQAHKARIAAKRVRYLLEPAAPHVKHGDDILKTLKWLQRELGTLHDAHLLGHQLGAAIESSAAAEAARLAEQAVRLTTNSSNHNGDGDGAKHRSHAPQSALATLGRRLGDDAQKAFDRVHKDWLSARYKRFKRDLAAFAKRLDESYGQAKPK